MASLGHNELTAFPFIGNMDFLRAARFNSFTPFANVSHHKTFQLYFKSLRLSDAYMHQETNHHWFRQWLVAWLVPSHYLNQCWNIVNWTLENKLQWHLNPNLHIFIQENAFEDVVWKIAAILSCPQCLKRPINLISLSLSWPQCVKNMNLDFLWCM